MNQVLSALLIFVWFLGCSELEEPCLLGEIEVTAGECVNDTTFQVTLSFNYLNAKNDFFEVFNREEESIGYFKLSELPVTIHNFRLSGNDLEYLKVCINDNPDCCEIAEFQAPVCASQNCVIGDLILDPGECTGENTYNLYLNFEYENADNDLFNVYGREDKLIGTYHLSELPITIEDFEGSSGDYDFIKVSINDQPDCFKAEEFQAPDCQ